MVECYLIRVPDDDDTVGLLFRKKGYTLQESLLEFVCDAQTVIKARLVLVDKEPTNHKEAYDITSRLMSGLMGKN